MVENIPHEVPHKDKSYILEDILMFSIIKATIFLHIYFVDIQIQMGIGILKKYVNLLLLFLIDFLFHGEQHFLVEKRKKKRRDNTMCLL